MKKSVKEQLDKHAVTPYPHKGWQSEFVVPVSVALRIIRRACNEAKRIGIQAGFQCGQDAQVLGGKKAALEMADEIATHHVSDIINGPRKAR